MRTVTSMNARTGGGDGRRGRAAAARVFDGVCTSGGGGGGGARVSRAFDEETRVARSSASSIAHCFSTNARRTARFSSSRLVSARASSRADSRSAARRRRAAAAPSPRARNPGHVSVSSFTHVNVTVVPSIAIVVLAGSTSAYKSHRHANGVAVAARLDLVPGVHRSNQSVTNRSTDRRESRVANAPTREQKITSRHRPRSRRVRTSRRPPRGVIASNRHRGRDLDRHRARGLHPRASVVLARPRTLVVVREGGERFGGMHTSVRRVHRARETVASSSSSSRSDESSRRRRRLLCLNPN